MFMPMNLLPFGKLAEYKPRKFVPVGTDLGNWEAIAPLFDELQARAGQCKSGGEFERWLLDWSELSAALDQESSCRYIAMTCHTDNEEAKRAYLHFVENVDPADQTAPVQAGTNLRRTWAAGAACAAAF